MYVPPLKMPENGLRLDLVKKRTISCFFSHRRTQFFYRQNTGTTDDDSAEY